MKTTLPIILLSLLLTLGLSSCSQSESAKEIQEIEESIDANNETQAREKVLAIIDEQTARFEERKKKNLENLVSSAEGREYMEKCLLRWKHTFVENGHITFKLTRNDAAELGFSSKEYDEIISLYDSMNDQADSFRAQKSESCDARFSFDEETFDKARNGTHEYYVYLKKYYTEHPEIPAIRER